MLSVKLEKITKKQRFIAAFAVVLLVFVLFRQGCNGEKAVKPKVEPVSESIYGLGTVKTDKSYNVRFGMNTIIRKLYVREGDIVKRDSPLVMNDSSLVAKSPFPGIVTSVSYLEGELAPAGQPIVGISGTSSMYIKVSLDQDSIILVKKGQAVEISFEKKRNEKITGRVSSVYMADDEFLVRIDCDVFPEWILPGMTCDTAILIGRKDNAILIPSKAINNSSVEIKRNGSRKVVKIEYRAVDENWSEVTDGGILPDDLVYIKEKPSSGKPGN